MSMRLLLDGEFGRYFDSLRTRGTLWVFQHVPKTAGSSLRGELAASLLPNAHIHLDGTDPTIPYHDRLDRAVAGFVRGIGTTPCRFVSGHIFERHIRAIRAAAPQARVLTYLRDPVARFVSDYRYQRTPMSPGHEAFCRQYPTIDDFLALDWTGNQTTRYLLPEALFHAKDAEAAADHLLDRFEFVGLQEDYGLCFVTLSRLLGIQRVPTERQRENPSTPDNPTELTPEQRVRIAEANAFDQAVFDVIRGRFQAIRVELARFLAERPKLAANG
ncbi:MAG: hypothetical protein MUF65_07700 [Rubritepida sp.]|jgi:hypothetical protein|nr:hypothetical protein [Rubritepida sp.]